ncbi:MAG: ABC transporter permease, partial [Pseudomonadota bacterium]
MIALESRATPHPAMALLSPVLAVALTLITGAGLFAALGLDPLAALRVYVLSPFGDAYSRSELIVKAVPLALIGAGLAVSFRANVWNIGAAGQ